jgi:hypothetical protein
LILFFALLPCTVFSQAGLELEIETFPENPVVFSPWSVYVLVNFPRAQELDIRPPRFPSSLLLERVRTEGRMIQGERWTCVEFLFTPLRPGEVNLEPFEVSVQGRRGRSKEINAYFREETQTLTRYTPRFYWTGPAPSAHTGEMLELHLELTNWDPMKRPPRFFFQGKAPRNAIINEGLPVPGGDGIYHYSISVLAMEGPTVVLERFSFQSDTYSLVIPEIRIPVMSRPMLQQEAGLPPPSIEADSAEISGDEDPEPAFPRVEAQVFPFFRREYRKITARAEALWEEGRRAEALADIRRSERDSLTGPFLVPQRRALEHALGLGLTEDERWRPLKLPLFSWAVLAFFILSVASLLFVFRYRILITPKDKASAKILSLLKPRGYKLIIISVLFFGFIFVLLEEGIGSFLPSRISSLERTAVLEQTQGYRVPDTRGAVNAQFAEGQPVIVSDYLGDWCYAETIDGRSGWVIREAVIPY